ncbi:hypothetical protein BGX38DRAFT_1267021 [Terfezia claveryi]|nr:hypothetical protein BGX38DRAFT_1267021 [Terfezia claveryi]
MEKFCGFDSFARKYGDEASKRLRQVQRSVHTLIDPIPAAALTSALHLNFHTAIEPIHIAQMRLYLEIPLFLLPAFFLTSEVPVVSASATGEIRRINHKKSRSPDSSEKYNLTLCAKQCRTEFFQYCHTRQPGAKGDSNVFRTCMCIYKSGTQYMDHCARHCDGEASFPEQMGELRAWWSNWCGVEKHEPTSTTSISIPGPSGSGADLDQSKISGMSLIGDDGKSGEDSLSPISSPKPKTTPESKQKGQGVSVITAGASVTFASAFLLLSYVMFMRRSKFARRRGILAWLRLKLLERPYRGGGAGLPRSRTTAMRMRVTNGRTEVVGNPKWLNKTMPPLPQPRGINTERSRDVQDSGNDTAHTGTNRRFLSRIMGRQEQTTPSGGLRRGGVLGRDQVRRKSHQCSLGYADDVEEEDEKVQNYFRSKGIARSGKHAWVSSTANRKALLEAASDKNKSQKGLLEGKEKMHSEGGLLVEEDDGVVESAEAGSQQQHLQAVNEDEEFIQEPLALTSRNAQSQHDTNKENYDEEEGGNKRAEWGYSQVNYGRSSARFVSPEEDYTTISATPQLDDGEWDSLTGVEGAQLNATGGLRRSARNIGESYGDGGLKFEEVDLVEPEYDGTGYYWTARSETHSLQSPPNSGTATTTTQGSSGYGPILPVFEPDPQHGEKSTECSDRQQHRKTRSKWRISGKVPKGLLGWRGKRSGESESTDFGRGTYKYL